MLAILSLSICQNGRFLDPFIYYKIHNFIILTPEKGKPFRQSLIV